MRVVTFLASRSVPGAPPAAAITPQPLPTHHHPVGAAPPWPGAPVWADGPALLAHRAGEQVGRRIRTSRRPIATTATASGAITGRPRAAAHAAPRRSRRSPPGAAAAPRALLTTAGLAAAAAAKAAGVAAAGIAATLPPAGAAAVAAVGGLAALSRLRGGSMRPMCAHAGHHAAQAAPHAREISIVTFNVRGVMDRWPERAPLLAETLRRLDADVYCFQEVLTGEFKQDAELVGEGYTVYECRAALESVAATGIAGAGYAAVMRGLLSLSLCRAALVAAPPAVEGFRERHELSGSWARTLRDAAIAPFFGNSLASRLAPSPPPGLEAFASEEASVGCGGGGGSGSGNEVFRAVKGAGGPGHEVLLLGHFRAAQRVCLALSPSAPSARGGAQSAHSTRSTGGGSVELQQRQSSGNGTNGGNSSGIGGNEEDGTGPSRDWQQQGGGVTAGVTAVTSGVTEEPLRVWLVNTHLDHASAETREAQAQAIVEWMAPVAACCAGVIITGDLNAPPGEGTHWVLQNAGYYSAAKLANGAEPSTTWPSGLVAPLMDTGEPHCADYIYVLESPGHELRVETARVAGDAPSTSDATLYPSDHFGLSVKLSVARRTAAR